MTLPNTIIFPQRVNFQNQKATENYFDDLIFTLQRMYEQVADGVNGQIRADVFTGASQWTPTLDGVTTTGTFTYTKQTGFTLRQGLLTDVWFDVAWSAAGAAAGALFLTLPYLVALTNDMPFTGHIQASSVAYTAGTQLSINAISSTFRGEIWCSGTGIATTNQLVVASGELIGYLRYLGQDER